ncbi:outer membrane protein OmpW [Edwardsiella anguillarum]|nr:outer membrane protein OmpW [Edwardsiella anguillarum]BET84039.1 outer membrane protein OmpW [Edwardsiella anguillarum]BET87405.1 outer membrane protein OmpW [Edwardsiella anguillarum]BET90832.1 outer membrane protein OmpW [Edwardsiella anguillarum]
MMKKCSVALCLAAVLAPAAASAHQAGDVIVRAGAATVRPTTSSDNVLGLGEFNVDNNTQLGLTFGYMATDNIGIELLAATPFRHKVSLGGLGNIATVHQLPPTLMAQWYFGRAEDKLRPYLGVGVNYTTFFNNSFDQNATSLGLHDLKATDSWGVAGQAGLDYMVSENWMINASVWYINIDTKVKFRDSSDNQHSINTNINPWVFMFGAGYRF